MKFFKKFGIWICLAASVLLIGTTAFGWEIPEAEKDTSTPVVEDTVEE